MAGLAAAHRIALTTLIERASDAVLASLIKAVSTLPGDKADQLRAMLAEQKRDRDRRAKVFSPLLPLFKARADQVRAVVFPPTILPRLWAAIRDREPDLLPILDERRHPRANAVCDRLCAAAAAAVRDRPDMIWPADLEPGGREAGLVDLAAALDLASVLRRGMPSLQAWLKRPDDDQVAALRLLLRDCAEVHPDGARRAFDVFFAHLDDAVLILRILAQVSEGAARETFLGQSELADFVDRLVAAVNQRVARIVAFRPADDLERIPEVTADLDWCGGVLAELDATLTLDRGGVWGRQSREARVALSAHISTLLRAADKAAGETFPMENARVAGRMTRKAPLLTAPSEGEGPAATLTLLRLVGALRGPSAVFGVEAARGALVDSISGQLTAWTDKALQELEEVEPAVADNALKLSDLAAESLQALGCTPLARTVRRRVAAARGRQRVAGASSKAA